jgi:hypothetical protein
MNKTIKLPFTNELKGGNKKSFKILNEEQLVKKLKKNDSMLNIIKKFIHLNDSNNNSNNSNKINYVKASNTKEYYKKLKK